MDRDRGARGKFIGCASLIAVVVCALAPPAASAARVVYVSNQTGVDVSALTINANGTLTAVAGSPFSTGGTTLTEGIAMTPDAGHVYVANFSPSTVAGLNVNANGSLTAAAGSPFGTGFSTPLGVVPDPDGGHLFAWNHGNAIAVSTIGANGALTNIAGSPFTVPSVPVVRTNPFGGSVAPDGNHLYVPNENNVPGSAPEAVTAYSVAANGAVAEIQTIGSGTLAVQSNPFGSAITPDGKFLYVANPEDGANGSISGFTVNASGTLTVLPGLQSLNASPGNHPLNMAISPDGAHLYVATRIGGNINAYDIAANGSLSTIAGQPFATGEGDTKALALTPDGKRIYVSSDSGNNITGFNVAANGGLTEIAGSPWGTGSAGVPDLESIVITPNQPPAAAFTAAAAPAAGQSTSFNGSGSSDSDGGTVASYEWHFGDGTTLTSGGSTTTHVYTQPGTYLAELTVTDNEGCSAERIFTGKATLCNGSVVAATTRTITVPAAAPSTPPTTSPGGSDTTRPRFQSGSVVPRTFAIDPRGLTEKVVSSVANGTTFRYSLSESARVVFTIDRKGTGRRVGRTCKKSTRGNRSKSKCTLLTRAGRFAKLSNGGANIKRFSGKIGRKSLRRASYQLTLNAKDLAGNRARRLVRSFRIVSR